MVQFDSIDPAALVVAIIAIVLTLEQILKTAFKSQTKKLKYILVHLLLTASLTSYPTKIVLDLDDTDILWIIENGLDFYSFFWNDKYAEINDILRRSPSCMTMRGQAWCIRNNFGIGLFFCRLAIIRTYLPWYYLLMKTKTKWCREYFSARKNINHNKGYSGKQFDACILSLLERLYMVNDSSEIKLLLNVVLMASYTDSKFIGPCISSQVACGQELTLGALLCDLKFLNPEGRFGRYIAVDMFSFKIYISARYGRYLGSAIPVLDELRGVANIFRYYRDSGKAKDIVYYDEVMALLFPIHKLMMGEFLEPPANWCSIDCESTPGKKCPWRGRPLLIMTKSELISMALAGKLNKKRCLVMDGDINERELVNILSVNNCDIQRISEVQLDSSLTFDGLISRIYDDSFIILAKSPPPIPFVSISDPQ